MLLAHVPPRLHLLVPRRAVTPPQKQELTELLQARNMLSWELAEEGGHKMCHSLSIWKRTSLWSCSSTSVSRMGVSTPCPCCCSQPCPSVWGARGGCRVASCHSTAAWGCLWPQAGSWGWQGTAAHPKGTASQQPQPNALRWRELQVFPQKHPGLDMTQGMIQAPEHKCVVTQLSIHYSGRTLSGES